MRTATSLLVFLIGCTSDNISSDEFLAALVNAECEQAFACKSTFPATSEVSFDDLFGTDEGSCRSTLADYYDNAAISAAIKAGHIAYDGKDGASCVNGLSAPDCESYWQYGLDYPDACFTALTGQVDEGGDCTIDFECAGEMYCDAATCVGP